MGTRIIGQPSIDSASGGTTYVIALVDLDLTTGNKRMHSARGSYFIGGTEFIGVGEKGAIGSLKDTKEVRPLALELMLSGVDANLVADMQLPEQHGRDVTVWLAEIDSDWQMVEEPAAPWWEGFINSASVRVDQDKATIALVCDHELIRFQRSSKARATDEHQQTLYPGDTFFSFLPQLSNRSVEWGGQAVRVDNSLGAGRDRTPGNRGGNRFVDP